MEGNDIQSSTLSNIVSLLVALWAVTSTESEARYLVKVNFYVSPATEEALSSAFRAKTDNTFSEVFEQTIAAQRMACVKEALSLRVLQ